MAIEVFNRKEMKFMVTDEILGELTKELLKYADYDKYNKDGAPYTISNIYFDTKDDILIRRSQEKPVYKEKLRLRAYGTPESEDLVFLEIKKKFNGVVNKRRTEMKLSEAYDFIAGRAVEEKPYMNGQVMRELEYFMSIYDLMPKVYIAYDRIAFFAKENPDLRISFDANIRTRRHNLCLEDETGTEPLLDEGRYVMEIKSGAGVPMWVPELLTEYGIRRQSFSKYGTEFKRYSGRKADEYSHKIAV